MQNIDNKNTSHDSDSDSGASASDSASAQSSEGEWKYPTCKHKFSFFQARPATGQPSSSNASTAKKSAPKRCYTEPIPLDLAKQHKLNEFACKLINEANEEHIYKNKPQQVVDEEPALISHNLLVTEGSGNWYLKVQSNCNCMCRFEVFIDNNELSSIPNVMSRYLGNVDLYEYESYTKRIVPAFQDLGINGEDSDSEQLNLVHQLMITGMGTIRITTYKTANNIEVKKTKEEKKKKKKAVISVSKPEFVNSTSSVPLLAHKYMPTGITCSTVLEESDDDDDDDVFEYDQSYVPRHTMFYYKNSVGYLQLKRLLHGEKDTTILDEYSVWQKKQQQKLENLKQGKEKRKQVADSKRERQEAKRRRMAAKSQGNSSATSKRKMKK